MSVSVTVIRYPKSVVEAPSTHIRPLIAQPSRTLISTSQFSGSKKWNRPESFAPAFTTCPPPDSPSAVRHPIFTSKRESRRHSVSASARQRPANAVAQGLPAENPRSL